MPLVLGITGHCVWEAAGEAVPWQTVAPPAQRTMLGEMNYMKNMTGVFAEWLASGDCFEVKNKHA